MSTNTVSAHRSWVRVLPLSAALVCLMATPARADSQDFDKGSLIIPMSASFQTPCGVISAYGLVWRILQSNQTGHLNATHPVTIYWAVNTNKSSPNRCVPDNKTTAPTPNVAGPSGATNHWDDPEWNDGCDFTVTNSSNMPVVHADVTTDPNAITGLYPYGSLTQLSSSGIGLPAYSAQTLTNSGFNTVQYAGGPFVIDSSDVANVLALMRSGDPSNGVPASELTKYSTACTCGSVPSTTCHYVEIHQATAPFSINVGKRINATPPKIALLDTGAGVKWCPGSTNDCSAQVHVLDTYLANAGLAYVDSTSAHQSAGGCPLGSRSNCNLNGSTAGPTGTKNPGLIYDQFNAYLDLISTGTDAYGLLNRSDAKGAPLYHVFWTPHWETDIVWNFSVNGNISRTGSDGYSDISALIPPTNTLGVTYTNYVPNGDGALNQRQNALNNVGYYLNRKSTGMLGECASIGGYEGAVSGANLPQYSTATAFMYNQPVTANVIGSAWNGRNCTDPNYSSGQCMIWPNAGSLFSQIGDWQFTLSTGTVQSFGSRTSTAYKSGVTRLALTWNNWKPTYTWSSPTDVARDNNNAWDIFTFGMKDNDTNKGTLLYVGGHEYTTSTVGNRLALNTLMNLGYDPVANERALTPPITYTDANYVSTDPNYNILVTGLYKAVLGYPAGVDYFNRGSETRWVFPYIPGEVRTHQVAAVSGFESQFGDATLWAANDSMPAPGSRNIFTYLGGRVLNSTTTPTLASKQLSSTVPPNGALQYGWTPEQFSSDTLTSAGACVDQQSLGKTPEGTFGMIPGADGICDLQEAMQYTALTQGGDYGVSEFATNRLLMLNDLPAVAQMIQIARGFCAADVGQIDGATPIYKPSIAQCNDDTADNLASLGGIVSSTPAVVGPSQLVTNGLNRPTMVYAGGYDGQLHALYLSGGGNYSTPTGAFTMPLGVTDATSEFNTDWASRFAASAAASVTGLPSPGAELWSFIPASQLPLIRSNQARITSPPVVMDAFVDLVGKGIREWHTILVAATDNEVFAMDVSNPLKPFLLWDVVGTLYQTGGYPYYSPNSLADITTPATAIKWSEPTAYFQLPPSTATSGRSMTGIYDYTTFGPAKGVTIGQARAGLQPVYAAYITTAFNTKGPASAGEEVFALELGTGQKLWQWEEPFTQAWVSDSTPATPTIVRTSDGISRVLAGDQEGHLWELDALTGINVNNANDPTIPVAACPSPPCNYVAFDTQSTSANPQPISTNINLSLMPPTPATGSPLAAYGGATVLTFGTSGEDWVYSLGTPKGSVAGKFHVLLNDARYRVPFTAGTGNMLDGITPWTLSSAITQAKAKGVIQEAYTPGNTFPMTLDKGETVYGTVSTAGELVTFGTTYLPIGTNVMSVSILGGGNAHLIDLGLGTDTETALTGGVYGGFAVGNSGNAGAGTSSNPVFALEAGRIVRLANAPTPTTATSPTNLGIRGQNGMLYNLKSWLQSLTQ